MLRSFTSSELADTYDVQLVTLDEYCQAKRIGRNDFLKTDTEGFELKVLKGAKNMLKSNSIHFIHVELFFAPNFVGQPSPGDIINFLEENNFSLVRFYDSQHLANGKASKVDALFVNNYFLDITKISGSYS